MDELLVVLTANVEDFEALGVQRYDLLRRG